MSIGIRWIFSLSASCLHAALALLRGQGAIDPVLADQLREAAESLDRQLASGDLEREGCFRQMIPLAAGIAGNRELADVLLRKVVGSGPRHAMLLDTLTRALGELERVYAQARPAGISELELRSQPIRQQWDAAGRGLVKTIARLTDAELVVERAEVILVDPYLGGGGEAHLAFNSVRLEAVLTNPIPELPEVLRLAWLIAQLHLDLPVHSETIARDRLPLVAGLAMLPPTLAAGEELGMTRCDATTLRRAIDGWQLRVLQPSGWDAEVAADAAWRWWQAYHQKKERPAVALAALDRLLRLSQQRKPVCSRSYWWLH